MEATEYETLKALVEIAKKMKKLHALVDKQAEDWQLWFDEPSERQRSALRELHALIEE